MKHTNLHELKHSSNGILGYTDLWGEKAHQIEKLRYVIYAWNPKRTYDMGKPGILLEIDLFTCSKLELHTFFKKCSDLVVRYRARHHRKKIITHTQFACVLSNGEVTPIKWFWINVDPSKPTIGHDIAFDTTLVTKWRDEINIPICLGRFRRKRLERCKHAMEKQTKQAYKTIANLILRV